MFGVMFGDVGQGLVLTLIGLLLGFYLKLEKT
jgi:vacuolar-type H+-ATPase subunit I/STV1